MLQLSIEELRLFQKVLHYIDERYTPKRTLYEDQYELLSSYQPIDADDMVDDIIAVDSFKKTENHPLKNLFCETILMYFTDDFERLKACCQKACLCARAFDKICEGTFSPTKAATCKFILAAEFDIERASRLLQSARISFCQYNKFDVVMSFFFENGIYDFSILNKILYILDLPLLGYEFVL